jgi:hypothetical protein
MLTIDLETARRFILGKQGLWPGRRWRGSKGTEKAMRELVARDPSFADALARGFARFAGFLDAGKANARAISEPLLRRRVSSNLPSAEYEE